MFNESNEVEKESNKLSITYSVSRPQNEPKSFIINQKVLQDSINHLYNAGLLKKEAALLWYGFYFLGGHNGADELVNCYIQNYYPISYDEANFISVGVTNKEISEYIKKLTSYRNKDFALFHIMMIHTHPGKAFHSSVDDLSLQKFGIGSYSLVLPNFAQGKKIFEEGMKSYFCNSKEDIIEILDIKSRFMIIKESLNEKEEIKQVSEKKSKIDEKKVIKSERKIKSLLKFWRGK